MTRRIQTVIERLHRKHGRKSTVAILTVRNVPDEVHRALRVRAAQRGRSTEAEVRAILAETVLREGRVGLGSMLAGVGRRARLTEDEFRNFAQRDAPPARLVDLIRRFGAPPM